MCVYIYDSDEIVVLSQGIDGAEASGLLSAAISSIRTVTAFNMQQSIQAGYSKVGRVVDIYLYQNENE